MQIIPLLADRDDTFENYTAFQGSGAVSSSNYGQLVFENKTDKTMIVPTNAAFMSKAFGQDHGMMHAGIISKKSTTTFNTAACVQQTQGGHISSADHKMDFLPFSLRETALSKRAQTDFKKLWEDIARFNSSLGIRQPSAHLEYFFDNFSKELNDFVAQFEPVKDQIGAIVLLDGNIVGIERTPNYTYWLTVWEPLIRGCYGALAVEYQKNKTDFSNVKDITKIVTPLNVTKVKSLADLISEYEKAEESQDDKVKKLVRGILDSEVFSDQATEQTVSSSVRKHIQNDHFTGQIVVDGPMCIYTSLITKKNWFKNGAKYASFANKPVFDI